MAMTDTAARQAKPQEKPYKLADGGGLFLYVTPKGSRLWRWKYRYEGKEKLMSFGAYPEVSLSQARKRHQEAREVRVAGADPMAFRKAEQMADTMTFQVVSEKWFKHWKPGKTKKHSADVWRRLKIDVLPAIGSIPANALTAAKVRDCIKAIEERWMLPSVSYRSAVRLCGMQWLTI